MAMFFLSSSCDYVTQSSVMFTVCCGLYVKRFLWSHVFKYLVPSWGHGYGTFRKWSLVGKSWSLIFRIWSPIGGSGSLGLDLELYSPTLLLSFLYFLHQLCILFSVCFLFQPQFLSNPCFLFHPDSWFVSVSCFSPDSCTTNRKKKVLVYPSVPVDLPVTMPSPTTMGSSLKPWANKFCFLLIVSCRLFGHNKKKKSTFQAFAETQTTLMFVPSEFLSAAITEVILQGHRYFFARWSHSFIIREGWWQGITALESELNVNMRRA